MHVSVILTTYNQPVWLEKVLWGYAAQNSPADEIVIADDGSDDRTKAVVDRFREETSLPLKQVWHPDEGFQKCRILNRAIEAASGDYLVFSDGDCIPRADFLTAHKRLAQPGKFLSGGYHKLSKRLSRKITQQDIQTGRAFNARWLVKNGMPRRRRTIRLVAPGWASGWLDRLTPTSPTWNGNNSSGWKSDIWRVRGFDERMQYGGLDRELGERLENAGVRGTQIRHRALCIHLAHRRSYASEETWRRNNAMPRPYAQVSLGRNQPRLASSWRLEGVRCVMRDMHLLIPTAQRPDLFRRVLDSLGKSKLPASLRSIVIVENGEPCGVDEICHEWSHHLPITYCWSPPPSKSIALNKGLEEISSDALVVMSDDDVRFETNTLLAYEKAVDWERRDLFYGGPFQADFAAEAPPEWVLARLPRSACGWMPGSEEFDSTRDFFFGCNWAVFARDLRAVGGFDTRLGPGGAVNSTGEETQLQRKLRRLGLQSRLVEDAVVWHYVPPDRCSPEWAVERARRHGAERGFATRSRDVARKVLYHVLNGGRFAVGAPISAVTDPVAGPLRLRMACERARSAGFFQGFYRQLNDAPKRTKASRPSLPVWEKVVRAVRKRRGKIAPPGAVALRWHCGRPNFGDDINRSFFEQIAQRPLRLGKASEPHLLGIGSLLEKATSQSVVLGSGFLHEPSGPRLAIGRACSVRGELSAGFLDIPHSEREDLWLGDPACLVNLFFERPTEPRYELGIIPHVCEVRRFRNQNLGEARVIDVRQPPWKVVQQIGECGAVLSQSLHGLIVADALGVPNGWLAPAPAMLGGEFKFRDYYTTTDRAKRAIAWNSDLVNRVSRLELFVSHYRFERTEYARRLRNSITLFAAGLNVSRSANQDKLEAAA